MTNGLLFIIVLQLFAILFLLKRKATDFSDEDSQVKNMTEQLKEARNRIPPEQ